MSAQEVMSEAVRGPNGNGDPSEGLLREFVERRSEAAFAELVRRHVNLVYGTALRACAGDSGLAQEVTQTVFIDLARKAVGLPAGVVLAGWLHRHARFVASHAVRTEVRRRTREGTAMELERLERGSQEAWDRLAPVLEEVLEGLPERDRDALVLRYLDGQAYPQVGRVLGVSADAARMRVDRAVDRLREALERRGITSTATALALVLGKHGVVAAPAGLASVIPAAVTAAGAGVGAAALSVAGVGAGTGTGGAGILAIMNSTKWAWALAGLVAAGSAGVTARMQSRAREAQARMAELGAEVSRLSASMAEAEASRVRDAAALEEARRDRERLAALRGEVGPLREAARERDRLRAEYERLASASASAGAREAQAGAEPEDEAEAARKAEEEQARAVGLLRMQFVKQWALAFQLFAQENDERMPGTFAEAEAFFPEAGRSVLSVFDVDRFEIVYRGRLDQVAEPARTILIREKAPFRTSESGKWLKTYAFADGHAEIHARNDGSFEAWEQERMAVPSRPAGGQGS